MVPAPTAQTDLKEPHENEIHVGGLHAITRVPHPPVSLQIVQDAVEAFLLSRRVANCSAATLRIYETNLGRFARVVGPAVALEDVSTRAIQHYLVGLHETMKPISAAQHDRNLRAFFRWAATAGLLASDPMRGIPRPRIPLPLPVVPTEEELRVVLMACAATFEGVRHCAVILTMAHAGLRAGELTHARVRDWNPADLRIMVRSGKGRKDRVTFLSPATAEGIRQHLAMRPGVGDSDPLFADAHGRALRSRHVVQILHRLSARAGLPTDRRVHPHTLRHFAATSWLRNGVGLDPFGGEPLLFCGLRRLLVARNAFII